MHKVKCVSQLQLCHSVVSSICSPISLMRDVSLNVRWYETMQHWLEKLIHPSDVVHTSVVESLHTCRDLGHKMKYRSTVVGIHTPLWHWIH